MISDLALRWVVTLMFLFSAGVCVSSILKHRHSIAGLISHSLHAVMAVAMAVMAWPRGAELPTRAPMIFFALAAVWFALATVATVGAGHRLSDLYHALMMLAMSWMYAAMGGLPLPRSGRSVAVMSESSSGHPGHAGHAAVMQSGTGSSWVHALNWVCVLFFATAAAFWFYRLITARLRGANGTVAILCQLAMAAGMAVMFAVML